MYITLFEPAFLKISVPELDSGMRVEAAPLTLIGLHRSRVKDDQGGLGRGMPGWGSMAKARSGLAMQDYLGLIAWTTCSGKSFKVPTFIG